MNNTTKNTGFKTDEETMDILLRTFLPQGNSIREIARNNNIPEANLLYYAKKKKISENSRFSKITYTDENFFHKIDTREKAYILGFLLGDGCISHRGHIVVAIALKDIEILQFISAEINSRITESFVTDKAKKKFPSASMHIGNNSMCKDLGMLFGGRLKKDRHIPIIKKEYELYMLQGFFDAEGYITWGVRKDRNRMWQKISFTSQYNMLIGIQNIFLKHGIATRIHPKSDSDCYVMELGDKSQVLECFDIIYPDKNFVVLKRKYRNFAALRLELGGFGGTV